MSRTPVQVVQAVAAIIRQGDEVLLVREQRPREPAIFWASPGGHVEPGELLLEALAREVREETGLRVLRPGRLAFVIQHTPPGNGAQAMIFYFEIDAWDGELQPADPDGVAVEAHFFPVAEAIRMLEKHLPWRREREPNIAYLRGEAAPGAFWVYRRQPDGDDELIAHG